MPFELEEELVEGYISVGENAEVYYHGGDDKLQRYFFGDGFWYHDWIDETDVGNNPVTDVKGEIVVRNYGNGNEVFYIAENDKIQVIEKEPCVYGVDGIDSPCYGGMNNEGHTGFENRDSGNRDAPADDNLENSFIELNVFPNPVSSKMSLSVNSSNIFINVTRIDGIACPKITSRLEGKKGANFIFNLDLENLSSGMYILQVSNKETGETIRTVKFIKI